MRDDSESAFKQEALIFFFLVRAGTAPAGKKVLGDQAWIAHVDQAQSSSSRNLLIG